MRGPSREALIKILSRPDAESHLPLILAKYRPDAIVRKEGERWVIRKLIDDRTAIDQAAAEAESAGESFRDENTWPPRLPGPVVIEAETKEDLIRAVKKMKWEYGEEDGRGETPFLKRR